MIFKLFIGEKQVTTEGVEYFEIVKGSPFSSNVGSFIKEYSTNITIPANENNIKIFQAHRLWGGTFDVLKGVVHFGFEAFEVLIQLVDFDEKTITIYFVKSIKDYTEILALTYKELLQSAGFDEHAITFISNAAEDYAEFQKYYGQIGVTSLFPVTPLSDLLDDAGVGDIVDFEGVSPTLSILQNKPKNTPKPFISVVNMHTFQNTGGLYVDFSEQIYNGIKGKPEEGFGLVRDSYLGSITWEDLGQEWVSPYVKCYIRLEWVRVLAPLTSEFRIRITPAGQPATLLTVTVSSRTATALINIATGTSYKIEFFAKEMAGIDPFNLVRVDVLGWGQTDKDAPKSIGYEPVLAGAPTTPLIDILRGLAVERGKYLYFEDSKIKFQDFPNIDTSDIVDVSHFFKRFVKAQIAPESPLKGRNNYINYTANSHGDYERVNIKVDSVGLKHLEPEHTLFTILFVNNRIFDEKHNPELPSTNQPLKLLENIEKFRVFRDAFNQTTLFQIEFSGLQEVPQKIMYIKQLNGLFLAEKIIKTSDKSLIINCYKLKKE